MYAVDGPPKSDHTLTMEKIYFLSILVVVEHNSLFKKTALPI
jgi:hypothetical protein